MIKKKNGIGWRSQESKIFLQSTLLENEMVKSLWIKASEQILDRC